MITKSLTYAETSHTNILCAHIQKAPTHFIMSNSGGTSSGVPEWMFSSSLSSEQWDQWCTGTFSVHNNVSYQWKLIIILFWYSCIACRGAISFLIKTNCLSLTSTEFIDCSYLTKTNMFSSRSPSLVSFFLMCASVSVRVCAAEKYENMFDIKYENKKKHLSWCVSSSLRQK